MARLRVLGLGFVAALALTILSSMVHGTYMIDCERDDPAPCVQVAAGFPLLYLVDHHGLSPGGRVDLLGGLIGEDILIGRNFWADVLVWWIAVLVFWSTLATPLQSGRTKSG